MANENVTITISLPKVVHAKWQADKDHKGLIAKLVAEHYGFTIKPRVVEKTSGA